MNFTIRKKFKFETSHVLDSSYSLSCQRYHGHSYILEVFLQSETLNSDGMVMDFGELKDIVKPIILFFDHFMIVSKKRWTEMVINNHPDIKCDHIHTMNDNPTAENMCKYIFSLIKEKTNLLQKVRLHETDTGWAEYKE